MIPPTSIDGTDITGATIDGTDVTEITVDGDTVFSAGADLPTAGLLHRYDASELTGETDGQNVDNLPDLEGSADLSRTGTVEYDAGGINGLPALRTFASGDGIMTGGSVLSQPFAVWYAYDFISDTGDYEQIFANSGGFDVSVRPGGNGNNLIWAGSSDLDAGSSIFGQQVAGWEFNGSSSTIYDGTTQLVTGNPGSNGTSGGFILFNRRISKSNNQAADALFGEMLIYDMSDPGYSETDVANYLGDKWGITV